MEDLVKTLLKKAKDAAQNAYAPYSKFHVGAALVDDHGNFFSGCNVENLAFPSGICAEQVAISKAVSEVGPSFSISMLLVYTPTQKVTTPCGSCRQVINEFATPETRIVSVCDSEEHLDITFTELHPHATMIDKLK